MDYNKLFLCSLTLIVLCCHETAADSYIAAVLEHNPSKESTPKTTIEKNINLYRDYANQAREKNADIIVFPEYGLTTLTDQVEDYAIEIPDNLTGISNPRSDSAHILQELRSIAFEHSIYLVINLLERTQDKKNKTIYYNTNLVLNRDGNLVAKYRKINLYNEDKLTPGEDDSLVIFTTDFGVTFTTFTCFDILFNNPARNIFRDTNVTDVVYPLAWYSHMPFFVSTSLQHAYSVAQGVNLLVAGYNSPKDGIGGSGIYLASGAVAESYISGTTGSRLIIKAVPKISQRQERDKCITSPRMTPQGLPGIGKKPNISEFITEKHFEHKKYNFKNVDLSKTDPNLQVCNNKFCCSFNISVADANTNEVFKVMAFNGKTQIGAKDEHMQFCALVACQNSNDDSCGARVNTTTKFTKIKVSGTLPNDNTTYYQPLTLTYNLLPIEDSTYCISADSDLDKIVVGLNLERSQNNLLAFGILGRSSAGHNLALACLLFAVMAFKLIF